MHASFVDKCRQLGHLETFDGNDPNNSAAQNLARQVQSAVDDTKVMSGRNTTDSAVISTIGAGSFLIPPRCEFYQNDVLHLDALLHTAAPATPFHFVSIDPPWWNKYIRRARNANHESAYPMMDSDTIQSIPLAHLVAANSLVAIWCTNSPAHFALIQERLLPHWQLRLLSTWYWVKITRSGATVCDFGLPLQKQPFEQLLVACHVDSQMDRFDALVEPRFLFSVPSAVHSHKPPIMGKRNSNSMHTRILVSNTHI